MIYVGICGKSHNQSLSNYPNKESGGMQNEYLELRDFSPTDEYVR